MKTLGDRLRYAREAAKLTQSELARRIGVRSQSVNQWESGERKPSRENIGHFSRLTNAPLDWLQFGGPLPSRDDEGRLIVPAERGRTVPMLKVAAAVAREEPREDAPRIHAYFPCGPNSYYFPLENNANAPAFPEGSLWIVDPDMKQEPGFMVLGAYGQERKPVLGVLKFEATPKGVVTIISPLNPNWAAARSDIEELDIVAVMAASVRGPRQF